MLSSMACPEMRVPHVRRVSPASVTRSFAGSFITTRSPSVASAASGAAGLGALRRCDPLRGWALRERLGAAESPHFPVTLTLLEMWRWLLLPPLLCALAAPLELLYYALLRVSVALCWAPAAADAAAEEDPLRRASETAALDGAALICAAAEGAAA